MEICSDIDSHTDIQTEVPKHVPVLRGINSLPPEVLEIILKMAINEAMKDQSYWSGKHDFLVDVAEVFPKFKYLAARKSLWLDQVIFSEPIRVHEEDKLREVIDGFFNAGITKLHLMGDYTATLSGDDILALADKCPKLEDFYILSFARIDNWPQFTKPWTSLRTLTWWTISEPNVFCNVEFHQSLPNLEVLLLGIRNCSNTFILPDMGGCEKLKRIDLCGKGSMFVTRLPRALWSICGATATLRSSTLASTKQHSREEFRGCGATESTSGQGPDFIYIMRDSGSVCVQNF